MNQRPAVIRQVYVSGAVLAIAASFVPLYSPDSPGDTYQTMTMWSAIPDYGSAIGVLAVALVLALAALALTAAVPGMLGLGAPVGILALSVVGALMLLARVGEGSDPPSFGAGAGLLFGSTVVLAVTAVIEIVLVLRRVDVSAAHTDHERRP